MDLLLPLPFNSPIHRLEEAFREEEGPEMQQEGIAETSIRMEISTSLDMVLRLHKLMSLRCLLLTSK